MLTAIKKFLGKDPKNEREMLLSLKEARRRDEKRHGEVVAEIKKLSDEEKKLLEEGKEEKIDSRKLRLARQIKEIRHRIEDLERKSELYSNRLKVVNSHIISLETVAEIEEEPIPEKRNVEEVGIRRKMLLENLGKLEELADGILASRDKAGVDEEDLAIIRELETIHLEEEKKKSEKKKEKPGKKLKSKERKKSRAREVGFEDDEA